MRKGNYNYNSNKAKAMVDTILMVEILLEAKNFFRRVK